jgi:hypothetical protein
MRARRAPLAHPVCRRSRGQEHAEHRAGGPRVLDVDPAVVLLHDARDHGEAEAGAAAALLRGVERVEDPIADVGGDPDAGIGDRDGDEVLLGAALEPGTSSWIKPLCFSK